MSKNMDYKPTDFFRNMKKDGFWKAFFEDIYQSRNLGLYTCLLATTVSIITTYNSMLLDNNEKPLGYDTYEYINKLFSKSLLEREIERIEECKKEQAENPRPISYKLKQIGENEFTFEPVFEEEKYDMFRN